MGRGDILLFSLVYIMLHLFFFNQRIFYTNMSARGPLIYTLVCIWYNFFYLGWTGVRDDECLRQMQNRRMIRQDVL